MFEFLDGTFEAAIVIGGCLLLLVFCCGLATGLLIVIGVQ